MSACSKKNKTELIGVIFLFSYSHCGTDASIMRPAEWRVNIPLRKALFRKLVACLYAIALFLKLRLFGENLGI